MCRTCAAGEKLSRVAVIAVVAGLTLTAAGAAPASATTIESFSVTTSDSQAGGSPDLGVSFALNTAPGAETAKSFAFNAPTGIALRPPTVPQCTSADFALDECSPFSQVGLVTIRAAHEEEPEYLMGTGPLFELEAQSSEFARLGFVIPTLNVAVIVGTSLREASDYGLRIGVDELPESAPLAAMHLLLWGFPAASAHNGERFPRGEPEAPPGCPGLEDTSCIGSPTPSAVPVKPLTLNPSICNVALNTSLELRTYQHPEAIDSAEAAYPQTTGCSKTHFNPVLYVVPTTTAAYSPSGLALHIVDPQTLGFEPSGSELRSSTVSLPEEMRINPHLPEDLISCSDAEAGLGSEEPSACPEEAELGSAIVELANIGEPIPGHVFLGTPGPEEEDRLLLVAAGAGIELKLVGTLQEDPEKGQLSITFANLPQLPASGYQLNFFGGQRSIFRTPVHCGIFRSEGTLSPWNAQLAAEPFASSFGLTTGPGGAPCIGEATAIKVALNPTSLPADGRSQTEATITISDANGVGIPEEELELSSSDPGQEIGELIDNEDGTYSAVITSSTTPGQSTITATDFSAEPSMSGSATLTQSGSSQASLPTASPPAPPPPAPPIVSFLRKPPRTSTNRRPRFLFKANLPGALFSCRLDRSAFRPCTPPVVLPRLSLGAHTFAVRASNRLVNGKPAVWHFRILRLSRKHLQRSR